MGRHSEVSGALLVSTNPLLIEQVGDVAAAAGVPLAVSGDPAAVGSANHRALLVGIELADRLLRADAADSAGALIVGGDDEQARLWQRAGELGTAGAVCLPSGSAWLVQWLHRRCTLATTRQCVVAATLGAAGGVGASTLAAALAVTAARQGLRPILIDAHPGPAGVDLLLSDGATQDNWSRFAAIRGFLQPTALQQLPVWEGVRCLGWGGGAERPLWRGALGSVIEAAGAEHDLAIADVDGTGLAELPSRTRAVVLAPASWRGVAAATASLAAVGESFAEPPLLVLRDVGGRTDPRGWQKHFPTEQVLHLGFDPAVIDDEDAGRPPGTRERSGLARTARLILAALARSAVAA